MVVEVRSAAAESDLRKRFDDKMTDELLARVWSQAPDGPSNGLV
jgi:hypothetical protein